MQLKTATIAVSKDGLGVEASAVIIFAATDMTRRRYFLLLIALLLIGLSWWGVVAALTGLVMRSLNVPELGFIFLLLPIFPLLMAILSFTGALLNQVWSYALGSALFFGWMIAAAFPLAA